MGRQVKITLIQRGGATESKEETVNTILDLIDQAAAERPDFICLNELSTTPYFCVTHDPKYFAWAESIPGPVTEAAAEKAKQYGCCILLPLYEKGLMEGVYYNSVVVIGPDGKIIDGIMPDGTKVHRYAKVHVPAIDIPGPNEMKTINETYYFQGGPGFPIFNTSKAIIGVLICYDRRFPEAARVLALQGAEIVFIPVDAPSLSPERGAATEKMFITELQTRALENAYWVAACNMGGYEELAGNKTQFFGNSCIIHPTGEVVAQAPSTKQALLTATIDLDDINKTRRFLLTYKYRRPELYGLVTKQI